MSFSRGNASPAQSVVMRLLHLLPPETAHEVTLKLLDARSYLPGISRQPRPVAPLRVMGMDFVNPCGIAAGLDKNGECIRGLTALGFGFVEFGTVTPRPQAGNPKPRLRRVAQKKALLNKMGFNNKGIDSLLERLNSFAGMRRQAGRCIIGINLGPNKDSLQDEKQALADYVDGLRRTHSAADYVCMNISSPNTPGLRQLQQQRSLTALLSRLKKEQTRLLKETGKYTPLSIKLSPDLSKAEIRSIAGIIGGTGMDCVAATNTSVRHPWQHEFGGGISGEPLAARSTEVLGELRHCLDKKVAMISVGGISSAEDMHLRLNAGADLVQIYTGLVYRGMALINELLASLLPTTGKQHV